MRSDCLPSSYREDLRYHVAVDLSEASGGARYWKGLEGGRHVTTKGLTWAALLPRWRADRLAEELGRFGIRASVERA
jgi:hypothetical protein